jgi:hypothetical protein
MNMSPKINIIFNLFLPVVGHFSWICSVNLENVPTLRKRGIQLAVFEKLLAFGGSAKNLWDTLKILNSYYYYSNCLFGFSGFVHW